MPIHGLTDHAPALPIIGQLRKGDEKKSENAPGKDLTHFRFVSQDADALQKWTEAYPSEEDARQVNVFLPGETTEDNLDAWMEEWRAGGLIRRCDKETQAVWQQGDGSYSTRPKACKFPECKCKQVGRMGVIIPQLGRLAQVTALTTSIHDIINLTRQLRQYEALHGDLRGIPFILTRRPVRISTPGTGKNKRVRREKWLLSIEPDPTWTRAKIKELEQKAMPALPDVVDAPDWRLEEDYTIEQLPAHIIDPTGGDDGEVESDPTIRPTLEPGQLKDFLKRKIVKSDLIDPETKEQIPLNFHPLKDETGIILQGSLREAMRLSTPADQDKPDTELDGEASVVLKWLTGKEKVTDLNAPQADALLDWLLNGDKGKEGAEIKPPAPTEARAVFVYAQKAKK